MAVDTTPGNRFVTNEFPFVDNSGWVAPAAGDTLMCAVEYEPCVSSMIEFAGFPIFRPMTPAAVSLATCIGFLRELSEMDVIVTHPAFFGSAGEIQIISTLLYVTGFAYYGRVFADQDKSCRAVVKLHIFPAFDCVARFASAAFHIFVNLSAVWVSVTFYTRFRGEYELILWFIACCGFMASDAGCGQMGTPEGKRSL